MYYHILYHGEKHFCCYYLQALNTEELLKRHIKDFLKINGKSKTIMIKKSQYVTLKNHEKIIKSPFIIYADFGNFLVPEDHGKQNTKEFYTKKYEKYILVAVR